MGAEVTVEKATEADCLELSGLLRKADADEIQASTGVDQETVILWSLDVSSESWAVRFGGELAFVWGVVETWAVPREGCGWMLTTDLVESMPVTFWRTCLTLFHGLLDRWAEVSNHIDARNSMSLRWGKRLGFRFDPPTPYGPKGLPFHAFRVSKEDLPCVRQQS